MEKPITVRELIIELQKYPQHLNVLVDGYELGYDPIKQLDVMELVQNPTTHDYEGQYISLEHREYQKEASWGEPRIPDRVGEEKYPMNSLVITADRGANG